MEKPESYQVNLEVFQGPMDLLLFLIRKRKLDIHDIPIAAITSEYLKYLEASDRINLEREAEYTSVEGLPAGVRSEVIDVPALKKAHRLADNPDKSEYMTLYFKEDFFKVHLIQADERVKRPQYRLTVDNPQDIELMREIYKALYKPGEIIPLEEVISFLDNHPELVEINSRIIPKKVRREVVTSGQARIKIIEE